MSFTALLTCCWASFTKLSTSLPRTLASIEIRLCPFSRLTSIRRWRAQGYLECVAGRITEESFEKFCCNHPEKIPYRQLNKKIQLWLDGFGYPANEGFRIGELAAMLHVSPKTVRRWISLTCLQVRQDRISRESVARFCGLHPEMIRFEVLSSETRELLTRMDRPGGPGGLRDSITLESLAAAGL